MDGKKGTVLVGLIVVLVLLVPVCGQLAKRSMPVSSELRVELPPGQKLVALTFDDGPHPEYTRALLDGLKEREIRATFFLVGSQLAYAPELVERMDREGHQIGVHTLDHVKVEGLSQEEFLHQVEGMRREIYRLVGERELWLRPPYGQMDERTPVWSDGPVILWSVDPEDWRDGDADRVARHIVSHTRDGDIVLAHDIYPSTVEGVLRAADGLRERGFVFVTVEQLLELRGIAPKSGQVYRCAP